MSFSLRININEEDTCEGIQFVVRIADAFGEEKLSKHGGRIAGFVKSTDSGFMFIAFIKGFIDRCWNHPEPE